MDWTALVHGMHVPAAAQACWHGKAHKVWQRAPIRGLRTQHTH